MSEETRCHTCQKAFTPSRSQRARLQKEEAPNLYCSRRCASIARNFHKDVYRGARAKVNCHQCGMGFTLNKTQDWKRRTKGETVFFCSKSCSSSWRIRLPHVQEAVRAANMRRLPELREQMRKMQEKAAAPEVRAKMRRTLERIGHQPKVRGGNGRGLTEPQQRLMDALNKGSSPHFVPEYSVRTHMKRGSGYPGAYKVDLANLDLKLAIEVDGKSHRSKRRQAQDRKKEEMLRHLGWSVLRLSNRQVTEHLEDSVRAVSSTISRLRSTTITLPKMS